MVAICNIQWFFFLFHQLFFALVPGLMLRYEVTLGNSPSGASYLFTCWDKIKGLTSSRDDRTELM